jgi:hypothetical protein
MNNGGTQETLQKKPDLYAALPRSAKELLVRIRHLWRGKIPLVRTFWLYYVAIIFVLRLFARTPGVTAEIFNVLTVLWAGFMVRPIIAAADNYGGDQIWVALAKICAGIIAICVLSDLISF